MTEIRLRSTSTPCPPMRFRYSPSGPSFPSTAWKMRTRLPCSRISSGRRPIGSGPFMVDEVVLNNYATLKRWDGYYKQGSGNIETIHMFASGENDANLVKNASAGQIDYAWSKSTDDAKAIEALDNNDCSYGQHPLHKMLLHQSVPS